MKKIYLISGVAIIFGMIFALHPEWFKFFWGWQILLLPLIVGIVMVLSQNEDRSYRFMPKLIIGSFLTSFILFFYGGRCIMITEAIFIFRRQYIQPCILRLSLFLAGLSES